MEGIASRRSYCRDTKQIKTAPSRKIQDGWRPWYTPVRFVRSTLQSLNAMPPLTSGSRFRYI
jgi:hypothetical protein